MGVLEGNEEAQRLKVMNGWASRISVYMIIVSSVLFISFREYPLLLLRKFIMTMEDVS